MVVVMAAEAGETEIEGVVDRVRAAGGDAFVSRGRSRTIVGLVGDVDRLDTLNLRGMPGVNDVVRISAPYKLVSREHHRERSVIRVAGVSLLRGGAYKPRSSPYAFQGLGETGLKILAEVRQATGLPVVTEVVDPADVDLVASYADMLQVGTRNMQNFPLLQAVGGVGKPVMLKRGMNATIEEWLMAAEYIAQRGNLDIVLCERGIRTFEKATRNTLDISAVPVAQRLSHLPVIVDPSHSGGRRDLVVPLSRAAIAVGADGIIVDVHPYPESALCDGPQALVESDLDAGALAGYGEREQTRTDHLRLVLQYAGWRVPRSLEVKELDEFLLARAMEHDLPSLLFRLACEHLRASQVVRPGVVTLSERVAAARAKAERETYDRLAHLLTDTRCSELDGLLVTDAEIGMAQLRWLNTGPVEASAAAVKTEVAKLLFLRGLDAHTLDLSVLPAERRRFLASVGRRSSMAKLARREPHRRYPIVLTVLAQSEVDVLDEVVQLFDQAVSARESRAKHKLADHLAERAKRSEDKLAIAEQVLPVLADPAVADEQVGGLLRERIGMGRLRAALAEPATSLLPRDHGHLAQLASSYGYLRQFTSQVLEAITFASGPAAAELLEAVAVLRSLNATGARSAPAEAPNGFVPARWRGYLDDALAAGDATAYRRYWELCVLLCLRDALRSGDVYVPGSRRYANPVAYLISRDAWARQRDEFCRLVGVSARRPWR